MVTAENSHQEDIQAIIKDIKTKILNFDAVLSSPSLGTGIDITFPNDSQEIDVVFGFFEAGITNHLEIDQQLARVRHPKELRVWISPRRFNYETELGVVTEEVLQSNLVANAYLGFDEETHEDLYDKNDALIRLASLVLSRNHASLNNLKDNFLKHKVQQGFSVEIIEVDETLKVIGSQALSKGRKALEELRIKKILTAPVISQIAYNDAHDLIKNSIGLDDRLRASYERHRLELFYRQQLSEQLVKMDADGRHRGRVARYERFLGAFDALRGSAPEDIESFVYSGAYNCIEERNPSTYTIRSPEVEAVMTLILLEKAGLLTTTGIDFEREISANDLQGIVDYLSDVTIKKIVELQLTPVRNDFRTKAVRFLGDLLKTIGFKLEGTRTEQKGTTKTYFYQVTEREKISMQDIVSRRRQTSRDEYAKKYWQRIHQQHGFSQRIYKDKLDMALHAEDDLIDDQFITDSTELEPSTLDVSIPFKSLQVDSKK